MSLERHRRAGSIFLEARELGGSERASFVAEACDEDDELRGIVESLLEHDDRRVENGDRDDGALGAGDPRRVGGYRIVSRLGEGGFGDVYVAEQSRPVRRQVALKIIKPGMDSRQVIARFEAERQALAMMDHPSIAKVFDAGTTDAGRPYVAMELVDGDPITAYCDSERLRIRDRLELFVQVCHAVQHAHQKGVIHRDLKPSNILVGGVDARPAPIIIDFGIAKAISADTRLTERTLVTEYRQLVGTPEYMSPEQAGLGVTDVDTRSDVYALGVLLYELLTGATPFDAGTLRSATWEEMRRIIREDEPARPSTRLHATDASAEIAACRGVDPARLTGQLKRDLDWIVMKCLEKDRSRRYESASALAADIDRYVAGEPVLAAPPSRAYRVGKFVGRHRGPVAACAAIALVLVVGVGATIIGTSVGLAEANRRTEELELVGELQNELLANLSSQDTADAMKGLLLAEYRATLEHDRVEEAEIARRVDEFGRVLASVDLPDVASGTLHQIIFEGALERIDEKLGDMPLLHARMLSTYAGKMYDLNLEEQAIDPLERAVEIRMRLLGEEHVDTFESRLLLLSLYNETRRYAEAEPLADELVEIGRRVFGPDDPKTILAINRRALLDHLFGRLDDALEGFLEAGMINNAGIARHSMGDFAGAEALFRQALEEKVNDPAFGPDHPSTHLIRKWIADVLMRQGELAEAEQYLREAIAVLEGAWGPKAKNVLHAKGLLVNLLREKYLATGDPDTLHEAHRIASDALADAREAALGTGVAPDWALRNHARILILLGDFTGAEEEIREAQAAIESGNTRFPITNPAFRHSLDLRLAEAYVELYEAWEAADADVDFEEQLEDWRSRLEEARSAMIELGYPID